MQTGRPPKPLALRAIEGDTRKVGINKHEEAIAAACNVSRGIPEMPACLADRLEDDAETLGLKNIAREHWDHIVPIMADEKLLALCDQSMLTGYCLAFAAMCQAGLKGDVKQLVPLMGEVRQFADRMGLNESARARLPRQKDKQQDPAATKSAAFLLKRKQPA